MKNDYVVGYCRPPKGSRFVKGKSGNPRGRPKTNQYAHRTERTHLKDAMVEVLQQRIDLPQEGHAKRITIQRAMVKSLVDRAIQGHNASTAMIWKLFKHYGLDREPDERARYFRLTPSVQKLIENALESVRKHEEWLAGTATDDTEKEEITHDEKEIAGSEKEEITHDDSVAKRARKEFLPKRANIMDDLLLELQEQIKIQEGGKSKRITKQQALLMSLVTQALRGNTTTFNLFWAIFHHYGLDEEPDKYLALRRWFPERLGFEEPPPRKVKRTHWPKLALT